MASINENLLQLGTLQQETSFSEADETFVPVSEASQVSTSNYIFSLHYYKKAVTTQDKQLIITPKNILV